MQCPVQIAEAPVLCFANVDSRCRWTQNCRHHRNEEVLGRSPNLAICGWEGIFYLFGCDAMWAPLTETLHESIEEAKQQAEFEYAGVGSCWRELPPSARLFPLVGPSAKSPGAPLSSEVVWAGHAYGYSGYAKMNREIALRISKSTRVHLAIESAREIALLDDQSRARLDALRGVEVSKKATLIRGYTPRREFAGGRRICFTMMETQTVHPDFARRINHAYDECWTPTAWNRDTFQRSGVRVPLHVMPLGVDADTFKPGPSGEMPLADLLTTRRAGSREQPKGFLFITAYQPTFRKGIGLLLDAFEEAFGRNEEVALVLATTVHSHSTVETDLRTKGRNARVYGLSGKFTEKELSGIFRASHAYVTASLGEGWNLPLCEAAACGLPVIAGRHSAHHELLSDKVAYLFDPDGYAPIADSKRICPWYEGQAFATFGRSSRDQLIALLRDVYTHDSNAREKGALASEMIRSRYTWDHSASNVLARLRAT
jgi:glycosyltransferase involved in cell wall biosynthesis